MERKKNTPIPEETVNTETADPKDPVIIDFKELILTTSRLIQPQSSAYEAAQRVIVFITDNTQNLDNLPLDDVVKVFKAASKYCERYIL